MSTDFYLARGETPFSKTVAISGTNTITIWTPATDRRVVLTELTVSTNVGGTIAFYFDNTVSYNFAAYHLGASAVISPRIGAIESTAVGGLIFARVGTSGTNSWQVSVTGFEII